MTPSNDTATQAITNFLFAQLVMNLGQVYQSGVGRSLQGREWKECRNHGICM